MADSPITMHDINTSLLTDDLTDDELLQVAMAVLMENDPRTLPVYPKCKDLFTDSGVRMHRDTQVAFNKIVAKRLTPKKETHATPSE